MGKSREAKKPLIPQNLDDIVVLGRYTLLVCLLTEFAFLSQLSNTMYMVYAGSSPAIKGCGNITFASMDDACANLHSCEDAPLELESQFYSVNEEKPVFGVCNLSEVRLARKSLAVIGQLSDKKMSRFRADFL
ncbi:unnamed protein product [Strongylus vulgaris]|uniref:Uncharacterized protein n=1 Tax=Strongylus vulgaris TaxID=40348 RepID=A0A3P7LGP2_STRVU|nr:unnamed protein product [Strongylus vulgaris]